VTWSIAASGVKAIVERKLEELDVPTELPDAEANDFEGAATYALLQVANMDHHVSVNASGWRKDDSMSVSISISQWKPIR